MTEINLIPNSFLVEVNPQVLEKSRNDNREFRILNFSLSFNEKKIFIEFYLSPLFALKTKIGDPIYPSTLCPTGARFVNEKWYRSSPCVGLAMDVGCCEVWARI
jgi:hypothetical protein